MMEIKLIRKINLSNDGNHFLFEGTPYQVTVVFAFFAFFSVFGENKKST